MLDFCNFPPVKGIVSLCTAEIFSFACNVYLLILTIVTIICSRIQNKDSSRWPSHTFTWALLVLNGFCVLLSASSWLLIQPSESVVIFQILHILTTISLPLCFYIFEKSFHIKYIPLLGTYCFLGALSKMLTVTAFSRHFLSWGWFSAVDTRFLSAVLQSILLFLLSFITASNFWLKMRSGFESVPSDEGSELVPDAPGSTRTLTNVLFLWCWNLLSKAKNSTLHLSDCSPLEAEESSEGVQPGEGLSLSQTLRWILLGRKARSLVYTGVAQFLLIALEFVPIYVVYRVLRNYEDEEVQEVPGDGLFTLGECLDNSYTLILLMFLSECGRCVLQQSYNFTSAHIAISTQLYLQELLYAKLSLLTQWEMGPGSGIPLTVDIDTVTAALQVFHQMWRIPLQFMICVVLLNLLIGGSALLPVGISFLVLGLVTWLLVRRAHCEASLQTKKQQNWFFRLEEYVKNIWILKIRNIHEIIRSRVLRKVVSERRVLCLFTTVQILKHTLLTVLVVTAFSLYHAIGGTHRTPLAAGCVSVLLLNMLRHLLSVGQTICRSVPGTAESLANINTLLARDEIEHTAVVPENDYIVTSSSSSSGEEVAVTVDNGTFAWESKRMAPKILSEINLEIPRGKITLVVGGEGSGKSSLLSAILGEMKCVVGAVTWAQEKDVALASQQPIVFGGSVQDNVLFGSKFDSDRYMKIITLCSLKEHTININESKSLHPISLARALYSRSSTLLLDEPLAGLLPESRDQFFFESVLLFAAGEEKRTVVMTTTNTDLIEHAHKVVLLDEGKIVFAGSPSDLSSKHAVLAELKLAGPKSLPPPIPHRRRLEKRVTVEPGNSIAVHRIPLSAYKEWVQSCSLLKLVCSLMLLSCTAFLMSITYWLLIKWLVAKGEAAGAPRHPIETPELLEDPGVKFNSTDTQQMYQFLVSGCGSLLFQIFAVVLLNSLVESGAQSLLLDMLGTIGRMSLALYNKTPLTSLLSRFVVDLELIGRPLMDCYVTLSFLSTELLCCLIVQAIVTPGSLVVTIPASVVTVLLYRLHRPCSLVLAILRTDLQQNTLKHITETVSCMTLIRGFGAVDRYHEDFTRQIRALSHAHTASSGVVSWVSLYQDLTMNLLVLGCFIATTLTRNSVDVGLPALSLLLLLLHIPHARQLWNVLDSCEVIARSLDNCTRLAFHSEREQATPRFKPPSDWPQRGHVTFQDVYAGMSADSESVLRGLSFEIEAGTKLGVGSTPNGGKSFLVPLLFRSLHLHHGTIKIDDWDINSLSLEDLRSGIGFVPSDPPLLSGTLRFNMDPRGKFDDEEIWRVIEEVGLLEYLTGDDITLDSQCGSSDLEREVRRVLYLAILLLEDHTLIVVEEPRVAVSNPGLEKQFYQVLDDLFSECTRVIIAHRSDTLLRCDKLLFLEAGRIGSFGSKNELMVKKCPFFGQISRQSRLLSTS